MGICSSCEVDHDDCHNHYYRNNIIQSCCNYNCTNHCYNNSKYCYNCYNNSRYHYNNTYYTKNGPVIRSPPYNPYLPSNPY